MPKRTDIRTILIIGAGPIIIGQACEFDYSGAQACKALREEGFRVVLVKDACGSGTTAMHETAVLNLANRLYGGAVADTGRACALMAGETVAAWQMRGAVPLPGPLEDVVEMDANMWKGGMEFFNGLNSPWFAMLDPEKFGKHVDRVQGRDPQVIAGCHTPVIKGDKLYGRGAGDRPDRPPAGRDPAAGRDHRGIDRHAGRARRRSGDRHRIGRQSGPRPGARHSRARPSCDGRARQ